jgi:hypothetical protein
MHVCMKQNRPIVCMLTYKFTRTCMSICSEESVNKGFEIIHDLNDVYIRKTKHLDIKQELKNHT